MPVLVVPRSGDATVGALYGIVAYRLDRCYRDMHDVAQRVHVASGCLAAALRHHDGPRVEILRWTLLHRSLAPYLRRTRHPRGPDDPGTFRPLRNRFSALWLAELHTDLALQTTAGRFLTTVTACFRDAQSILDEAVATYPGRTDLADA